MNPLLSSAGPIPFDAIKPDHVEPAIAERLKVAKAQIDEIGSCVVEPTYANTFKQLEHATRAVELTMTWVGLLEALLDDPKLREAYNAIQPSVAAFYATIPHNNALWSRLKAFDETKERTELNEVRSRFVEETIKDFRRHGADLNSADKQALAEIDVELAQETNRFGQNVVDDTDAYELILTDEARLAGLPQSAINAARKSAESKGLDGWRFTLQGPSIIAVLTHLDDRSIRETVYKRYNTRATQGDTDNRERLGTILELRQKKAKLLGYSDVADLFLDGRMVQNGAAAQTFVDDLCAKTREAAQKEHDSLSHFSAEDCGAQHGLEPWDIGYFAEKQRKALYDFDEEEVRPYLSVRSVLNGLFELANRLFGVNAVPADYPKWHSDVQTFELHGADGQRAGVFYLDIFPREGKRGGAWMCPLRTGTSGDPDNPHYGMIGANFTSPGNDGVALLKHREVETLFHEFGHLLHHLMTTVEVPSLAGTNVAWDFVELPSQIMENWCWERESLELFARHYETNEVIPDDLMERMRSARTYRAGYLMMRQLSFGSVDLKLHRDYTPERDGSVVDYAYAVANDFSPVRLPEGYAMIASFNHLFSSPVGYAAAYYSYKWAEVLEADAFTRFKKEGLFSAEVGGELRDKILSQGNSADPMTLFVNFMGREPDPDALLERAGLTR